MKNRRNTLLNASNCMIFCVSSPCFPEFKIPTGNGIDNNRNMWLGITGSHKKYWEHTDQLVYFNKWTSSSPSSHLCAVMLQSDKLWRPVGCDNRHYAFICELQGNYCTYPMHQPSKRQNHLNKIINYR